jgi:predicted ester cyclase
VSLEENKAIVRKMFEAFNKRNLASLDELIAHDYVDDTNQLRGLEDAKQFLTVLIKGFPDLLMTIEDMIAEGDRVWVRTRVTGTNTGEFRGEAPTGKKYIYTDVHNFRIANGKIVEDIMVSAHS